MAAPINEHVWYDNMYAKLFDPQPNAYNTMTEDDFAGQAAGLVALVMAKVPKFLKSKLPGGGDSEVTSIVGWPDWFIKGQDTLVTMTVWTELEEELHRLLYMYACWRLASGAEAAAATDPTPPADRPSDGSDVLEELADALESAWSRLIDAAVETVKAAFSGDPPADTPAPTDPPADGDAPAANPNETPADFEAKLIALGEAEAAPPPAPTVTPGLSKNNLPRNMEYLFRFIGKSKANLNAAGQFAYRKRNADNKYNNVQITTVAELSGGGPMNWCGPASFTPFKKSLGRLGLRGDGDDGNGPPGKWGRAARCQFVQMKKDKLDKRRATPVATLIKAGGGNLDLDDKFKAVDEVPLNPGDVIWMINKVGPLSGHVATIVRSEPKVGAPAQVTWVSGNAGGAKGGTVRIQTVWRVAIDNPDYDYSDVAIPANRRDDLGNQLKKQAGDVQVNKGTSGTEAFDLSGVEKARAEDKLSADAAATADKLKAAEASVAKGAGGSNKLRPDVTRTHWLVAVFPLSQFDLANLDPNDAAKLKKLKLTK